MARVGISMQITAVDHESNLFRITDVFPKSIVDLVLNESWLELDWEPQQGQESWRRRRIKHTAIAWINQWHDYLKSVWPTIQSQLSVPINEYIDTAFWVDEPGFQCPLHTDGEMPGSMQLTWRGPGTSFYWYKDTKSLRYTVPAQINAGYIIINQADSTGYRPLLWHAMLDTVPADSYRLSTYTWIVPAAK